MARDHHHDVLIVFTVSLFVVLGIFAFQEPSVNANVVAADLDSTSTQVSQESFDSLRGESASRIESSPVAVSACQKSGLGKVTVQSLAGEEIFENTCASSSELLVVSCTGSGHVSYTAFPCLSGTRCQEGSCQ